MTGVSEFGLALGAITVRPVNTELDTVREPRVASSPLTGTSAVQTTTRFVRSNS